MLNIEGFELINYNKYITDDEAYTNEKTSGCCSSANKKSNKRPIDEQYWPIRMEMKLVDKPDD